MSIVQELNSRIRSRLPDILGLRRERKKKEDGSFVTQADFLVHDLVAAYLGALDDRYVLISEEGENVRATSPQGNYLVLDPIDGTENFTSGLPLWGVCISVYREGKHRESGLLFPELDCSLVTGQRLERHSSRLLGLSSLLSREDLERSSSGRDYRLFGSSAYSMYCAITGALSGYEHHSGAYTWDVLAGLNLALEQGRDAEVDGRVYAGEFLPAGQKYKIRIG